jgi:precorrin-2 dehydrogenase/sirohydrochlorin ferrochelatase
MKKDAYYPICLDLSGKSCLVIGGGEVAERKIVTLLKSGARVRVVSPEVTGGIRRLVETKSVALTERKYQAGDLEGNFLVISATDDSAANAAIAEEADRKNILLNVVDFPAECNFIVPASLVRGGLMISVSTSGKSPALARKIRRRIQQEYGPEYGPLLDILGACREKILQRVPDIETRKQIFERLTETITPETIRDANIERIMSVIRPAINEKDFPFEELEAEIRGIMAAYR